MPLAKDVTVSDLLDGGTLEKPHEFLLHLWRDLKECDDKYGNAYVQIGVSPSSKGKSPSYKITYIGPDGLNHYDAFDTRGQNTSKV